MKFGNIKKIAIIPLAFCSLLVMVLVNSCAESKLVAAKSGAQLWAENCQRCHNTPPPNTFSQDQWKTVGMHMQTRALITNNERDRIVAFLQQAN